MREIKFRVWDKILCNYSKNTMGWYHSKNGIVSPETGDRYIFEEFIVNEDNNDIYEGDRIQEIKYGRVIREFIARDIRTFIKEYNNAEHGSIFKVIGTIHDQKAEV